MKILYITHSPIIGGAEISLLSHLRHIDKAKYSVTLVCSEILARKAGEVEGLEVIPMKFYLLSGINPVRWIRFIQMVYRIRQIVKEKQIALMHTNSVKAHYIGTAASLFTNTPLVWWIRDDTMSHWIFKLTSRIPVQIIFVSHYLSYLYPKAANSIVIHNGTDIAAMKITEAEQTELKSDLAIDDRKVILCVERLVKWKGVEILIDALSLLKRTDYLCLIIGTGKNQRGNIEFDLIRSAGEKGLTDQVKFLGWREDTYRYYQVADMLVHPVISPEPFGLVVIEAMTFGVPVISSDIGGPGEIISDCEDGMLIAAGNSEKLAATITLLLDNRGIRRTLGENARMKVMGNFTQIIETSNVERIYDKLSPHKRIRTLTG